MFPGPHAQVYYNEAGEPIRWDNHYYDEPDYDPYDREGTYAMECAAEDAWEFALDEGASDEDAEEFSQYRVQQKGVTTEDAWRTWLSRKLGTL